MHRFFIFKIHAMKKLSFTPEEFFFEDDGIIPNSPYPLLVYRNAFAELGTAGAEFLENIFRKNNWSNSWRGGIYSFHHYHSNTHEVLGVFQGSAEVQMGGPNGQKIEISSGDMIVIPAGVGHQCLSHSDDFTVVGAYPDGMKPDLIKEEKDHYTVSLRHIQKVPKPSYDPLSGKDGDLIKRWKQQKTDTHERF